jgi:hypothetical protein
MVRSHRSILQHHSEELVKQIEQCLSERRFGGPPFRGRPNRISSVIVLR